MKMINDPKKIKNDEYDDCNEFEDSYENIDLDLIMEQEEENENLDLEWAKLMIDLAEMGFNE